MVDEGTESIWNFDGAQFYTIFQIKSQFVNAMLKWDLEGAYWAIRTLRMEFDAKLKRKETHKMLAALDEEKIKAGKKSAKTEKQEVDEEMIKVDIERKIYIESGGADSEEAKVKFYAVLEDFYMDLCYRMKKHRMYFREGEDMRLAVLRR